MDGFTEKKWFVYLSDHHEGPFSLSEIQDKMNFGQLSATNYVWAEGMADWTVMNEVQAFESILQPPPQPPTPEPVVAEAPAMELSGEPVLAPAGFSGISLEPMAAGPILSAVVHQPPQESHEDFNEFTGPRNLPRRSTLMVRLTRIGFVLIIFGAIGYAYNVGYLSPFLQSQTAKSLIETTTDALQPILSKLGISPIPKLDDVSPEEYARLEAAAEASLSQAGPQIAVALSKSELLDPTFYVASNLPDRTILDIELEGIPETLLNQLSFSAKTEVILTRKFGKTGPLQFSQGHALPRGQYNLYIVDPGTEPPAVTPLLARLPALQAGPKGLRAIGAQSYFLGGARDATYSAQLKEFHDGVAAKAQQELTELKQIAVTLDSQLADTNRKFAALKHGRKPTLSQKRAWNQYHERWGKLSQQLAQLFSKLTPEALEKDYFYGWLYQMGQRTSDAINQLHSIQTSYFTGGAGGIWDPKAFGIQLGESQASAKSAEDLLNATIDQIEKLPPGPSGLPQRIPQDPKTGS